MNLRELLMNAFSNPTTDVADPSYQPSAPSRWSLGKSSAFRQPTVPERDGPMTDADVEALMANGPMNDSNIPPQLSQPAPAYDEQGMQMLVDQIQNPEQGITEGPNARIDDATRARALAQIAALRG